MWTRLWCLQFGAAADMLFATGLRPVRSVEYSTVDSSTKFLLRKLQSDKIRDFIMLNFTAVFAFQKTVIKDNP
jgi:hypothetical protein